MTADRRLLIEEWRPIAGHTGYEVSSFGRVRSYWQRYRPGLGVEPHLLKLSQTGRGGYLCVGLRENGDGTRIRTKRVHSLVLEAFVGPCPPGLEARHGDGDPTNNTPSNLSWGTRRQNADDRVRHRATPSRYCTWGHDLMEVGRRGRWCPTCDEMNRPQRCHLRHPSYTRAEAIEFEGKAWCPACYRALMLLRK